MTTINKIWCDVTLRSLHEAKVKKNKLQCTETNSRDRKNTAPWCVHVGEGIKLFDEHCSMIMIQLKTAFYFARSLSDFEMGDIYVCNQQSKTINRQQTQQSISIASKISAFITSTSISIARISI